ncbi:MAG: HAD family hydrolase, partial [Rhodospirillaceae bacterium]|nr:HAD family hydrolase [Rhodospirillaceae bacterium]
MDDLLRGRLAGLKLLSLDTDGVLTDGGLYYTDAGDEMR